MESLENIVDLNVNVVAEAKGYKKEEALNLKPVMILSGGTFPYNSNQLFTLNAIYFINEISFLYFTYSVVTFSNSHIWNPWFATLGNIAIEK